jgi:TRAP-type C4-dicarboxylate transport system permease small subunit
LVRMLIRVSDGVDRLVRVLAVPVGAAFILIVFFGVVMRYVFQAPIITSIELARVGFVWSCFLGAAVCVKKEKHIQFSFLLDAAGPAARSWMKLAITLLSAAFFLLLVVKGAQMVLKVEGTYFPAMGHSQAWLYLPLPLCALFMLIHALAFLARDLQSIRSFRGEGETS